MPRSRSCVSTMERRAVSKNSPTREVMCDSEGLSAIPQLFYLLFPTPDSHVEAHNPVLVAQSDNGDITGDVVYPLNDLLRSLRNISAIRERQIVLNLLFD